MKTEKREHMNKLFSVIIPCYNAEKFIDRAMGSVFAQTVDPSLYEVIAVDDASTDDTLKCLRKWEEKHPDTLSVITYDTNLRQGGARNIAMKQAIGEYICFLDADDWMERDALETFRSVLVEKEYDIVTAKHVEDYDYTLLSETFDFARKESVPVLRTFDESDIQDYIIFDLGFVWGSVYKHSMIITNDVWFPEHLAYEDIYWQRLIKYYMKNACLIDAVTHHHYNHSGSTMNSKNATHHTDRLTSYEMLLEEYLKRDLLTQFYGQILNDTIETYYFNSYYMFFTIMDDVPDVYSRIRNTIYSYFPDWETEYNDGDIPMVFQYMLKLLKKAQRVSPREMQPFKETILELLAE